MRVKRRTYNSSKSISVTPKKGEQEVIKDLTRTDENKKYFRAMFCNTDDLKIREIKIRNQKGILVYLNPVIDSQLLQKKLEQVLVVKSDDILSSNHEFVEINDLSKAIQQILKGNCVLSIEGLSKMIVLEDVKVSNFRSPDEPNNEKVIRGAHDGFIENLDTNIFLLRQRILNQNLNIKYMTIGSESNTRCAIAYLNHLVDNEVLLMVRERLQDISTDSVINLGYIEEFIEDSPYSPFPQTLMSERPDRIASNLYEGRIAIFLEGAPGALVVPITFFSFIKSSDDYSSRWIMGSFYRSLRLFSLFIAVFLPAIYVSIVSFHSEVIPRGLVILFKASVEDIPYPPIIEALIMEVTLELLREAGVRLPNPIGQTIGIVGGLVIGDAIVRAGLVSSFMIIVVALTAISSFVVPIHEMSASIRLIRFPLMIAAATFGLIGIVYGLMLILIHLCRLNSLGKPYFSPVAPFDITGLKDTFVRFPFWKLNQRPAETDSPQVTKERESREWDKDGK